MGKISVAGCWCCPCSLLHWVDIVNSNTFAFTYWDKMLHKWWSLISLSIIFSNWYSFWFKAYICRACYCCSLYVTAVPLLCPLCHKIADPVCLRKWDILQNEALRFCIWATGSSTEETRSHLMITWEEPVEDKHPLSEWSHCWNALRDSS